MNNALMLVHTASSYSYETIYFSKQLRRKKKLQKKGTLAAWNRKKKHARLLFSKALHEDFVRISKITSVVNSLTISIRSCLRVACQWRGKCETGARSLRRMNGRRNAAPHMKQPVKHYAKTFAGPAGLRTQASVDSATFLIVYFCYHQQIIVITLK